MTPHEARLTFLDVLSEVAPEADFVAVLAGADVRYVCRLDHARFRRVCDLLSERVGFTVHYDDADADCLRTVDEAVRFLVNESARLSLLDLHPAG